MPLQTAGKDNIKRSPGGCSPISNEIEEEPQIEKKAVDGLRVFFNEMEEGHTTTG